MLGKKSSVATLKEALRMKGVSITKLGLLLFISLIVIGSVYSLHCALASCSTV